MLCACLMQVQVRISDLRSSVPVLCPSALHVSAWVAEANEPSSLILQVRLTLDIERQ